MTKITLRPTAASWRGITAARASNRLAAGVDLVAAIDDTITLAPGERQISRPDSPLRYHRAMRRKSDPVPVSQRKME